MDPSEAARRMTPLIGWLSTIAVRDEDLRDRMRTIAEHVAHNEEPDEESGDGRTISLICREMLGVLEELCIAAFNEQLNRMPTSSVPVSTSGDSPVLSSIIDTLRDDLRAGLRDRMRTTAEHVSHNEEPDEESRDSRTVISLICREMCGVFEVLCIAAFNEQVNRMSTSSVHVSTRLGDSLVSSSSSVHVSTSEDRPISSSCGTVETKGVLPSQEDHVGSDGSSGILHAQCRICHEEVDVKKLETPCACRGSLMHAHRRCIQRWCDQKRDHTICEICQQPYKHDYSSAAGRAAGRPCLNQGAVLQLLPLLWMV